MESHRHAGSIVAYSWFKHGRPTVDQLTVAIITLIICYYIIFAAITIMYILSINNGLMFFLNEQPSV